MAACGFFHTLAVTEEGSLWTWGLGAQGQLGHGDRENQLLPTCIAPGGLGDAKVVVAAGGRGHSVCATEDGAVWCWGSNASAQLGTGDYKRHTRPNRLAPSCFGFAPVVLVACGADHTVALTDQGEVWAWGSGSKSQLGLGDKESRLAPARVQVEQFDSGQGRAFFVMVAAGDAHTVCIEAEGVVWSWGSGVEGCLGDGDTLAKCDPAPLDRAQAFDGARVVLVAAGAAHTVAVGYDGEMWAWGNGSSGQLGLGDTRSRLEPARVQIKLPGDNGAVPSGARPGSRIVSAACGAFHTLAVCDHWCLWVWGAGADKQLGLDDGASKLLPTPLDAACFEGAAVVGAGGGYLHSWALTDVGDVWTWGEGNADEAGTCEPTGLGI